MLQKLHPTYLYMCIFLKKWALRHAHVLSGMEPPTFVPGQKLMLAADCLTESDRETTPAVLNIKYSFLPNS